MRQETLVGVIEGLWLQNIQYHPGKANVVADALSRKSGMIAGIKVEEEIIRDLERLDIELCVRGQNGPTLREALMTEAHSSPFSIHPGSTKMYHDLKQHFWWSGMKRDVPPSADRGTDRGSTFTSRFWKGLQKLGEPGSVQLRFSS
ncbi:retrotransposable element Tf2 [Tanacetum coccineum]